VGRQPWTVYGLLRTADSVSPSLSTGNVALSFAGYIVAYLIIYSFGARYMWRLARRGPLTSDTPQATVPTPPPSPQLRAAHLSAVAHEQRQERI